MFYTTFVFSLFFFFLPVKAFVFSPLFIHKSNPTQDGKHGEMESVHSHVSITDSLTFYIKPLLTRNLMMFYSLPAISPLIQRPVLHLIPQI